MRAVMGVIFEKVLLYGYSLHITLFWEAENVALEEKIHLTQMCLSSK